MLALLVALGRVSCGQGSGWDAFSDFSTTQNPNGAWTYGWSFSTGSTFNLLQQPATNCGVTGWLPLGLSFPGCAKPNGQPSCIGQSLPPGYLITHPGPAGENTVLRWTAPTAGLYSVSVSVMGANYAYPTTTDIHLLWGGAQVWATVVNSYLNLETHLQMQVATAGTTIDLAIGYGNGNYYGDATAIGVTVTGPCALPGSTLSIGAGCGGGWPGQPTLVSTAPILGTTATLLIAGAPIGSAGDVFLGSALTTPLAIPSGCFVYLDPFNVVPVLPVFIDGGGNWSTQIPIPSNPALIGLEFAIQAVTAPAPNGLGIAVTNGLCITIG